jgi:hypothetical protein
MRELPEIDRVLQAAIDRGEIPGVVAMAATRDGPSIKVYTAGARCPTDRR